MRSTNQLPGKTKKVKVRQILALINELQIQDTISSDDELDILQSSKTAMVCKLAQIPPEIGMTLPLNAKLNERECQQQEDEKTKQPKSLIKIAAIPICLINMQEFKIL